MKTSIDAISDGIYRLSTYIEPIDFSFNQYLVDAREPLLFHCGMRSLFPSVAAALSQVMPPERLRWISFGHFEADECGAMNDWLAIAPQARIAFGELGCRIAINDLAARAPLPLSDGQVLDLGGRRVRYLATPHVPHCWDAGLLFEETTATLLCGDLFAQSGNAPALTSDEIVEAAFALENKGGATALTPNTAATILRLAGLAPQCLALMHGPAFNGDCAGALRRLADGYASRLAAATRNSRTRSVA